MRWIHDCTAIPSLVTRVRSGQPTLLLALGDSNTCNTDFTAGAKQWPELLHARLKVAAGSQTLLLVNAGVSGDTVHEVQARFESDVARFRPEMVILALGTNDANRLTDDEFRSGMREVIDRLQALGSQILLRTVPPIWERQPSRIWPDDAALQAKIAITRSLAAERALPFVDIYGWWRELEQTGDLVIESLMTDEIHTNAAGHALISQQLGQAFGM